MKKYLVIGLALLVVAGFAFASGRQEPTTEPAGKVVDVFGVFRPPEDVRFLEAIKPFEVRTGIDVRYEYSPEFETLIFVRVEGGDPPDIAALPQPGLMKTFADRGALVPLWSKMKQVILDNYAPVWLDLGSHKGEAYGVFHRVNLKSLVWYPKNPWNDAGFGIPTTWDELETLENKMIGMGEVPWTVGFESGAATGWPATDWMEDIMLRTAGPDVYDQWVNHDIPFNNRYVKEAAEIIGKRFLDPKYVYGGPEYILTANFGNDAPNVMFEDPPGAWMHRQGNFITGFFPESVKQDLDNQVGVFGFPQIDPQWGTPALGGGDQFVMFNDRPEVRQFMEFLATWESGEAWARTGGALFAYKNQDISAYPTEIEQAQAELLLNAKVFRFDASDLMPAEVGAGTFWTGMVDALSGVPLDRVLQEIEDSWP